MQTLPQELDNANHSLAEADRPALQALMADRIAAHAAEVEVLRQRIAMLEAELAAAKKAAADVVPFPQDLAAHASTVASAAGQSSSEFSEPVEPAVRPVTADATSLVDTAASPSAESADTVSDPGFAEAWSAEGDVSTFEERVAERMFFQASTVDEQSRNWLLAK